MLDLLDDRNRADERVAAVRAADLEAEAVTRGNVALFTRAMWIAVLMLLLFNSAALVTVVNGFGVGPVQDGVVALSATWNEQMEKNGLSKPGTVIRKAVERWRNVGWAELQAGLDGTQPQQNALMLRREPRG
ncbi:MAG: hypothetical protein WBG82_02195 [Parvibaculum sp.]|uniref:hypothetical protein n=1 Tax=Parvibaculum sp. TaxID=2024848 RepID=UPI003C77BD96